jgi:hypothetical protein
MARFRGTVQGGRGEATRLGHGTCGLVVRAQSYTGDVRVSMYSQEDEDHVCISVSNHAEWGQAKAIYDGPVKDLIDQSARKTMLQHLAQDMLLNG